jgi:hypothetical protein
LEGILGNNFASFGESFFRQIRGTAMGSVAAPSFANITMTKFERGFLDSVILKPSIWFRFFDDIFFCLESWSGCFEFIYGKTEYF